jgi:hypothetical protein
MVALKVPWCGIRFAEAMEQTLVFSQLTPAGVKAGAPAGDGLLAGGGPAPDLQARVII